MRKPCFGIFYLLMHQEDETKERLALGHSVWHREGRAAGRSGRAVNLVEGSTFTVYLPATTEKAATSRAEDQGRSGTTCRATASWRTRLPC